MADICEICMRLIQIREEGAMIDYDEWVLCAKCIEKVENHNEKYPRRSFERCVREIQKIRDNNKKK